MKIKLPNEVKIALQIIHQNGYEAYVVGGCVRDALIGRQTHDYDITTNANPFRIMEIFTGYTVVQTGLKHGTLTVIVHNMPIEITTYRIDGTYTDNRHPNKVEFTQELKDDLKRRDFTMNAIAYNENQGIIDLFEGQKDIANRVICCVGNPDDRFKEDALRMIRALRFSSTLGFRIGKNVAQSIHTNKELLRNISIERITSEFSKMICGEYIESNLIEFFDVIAVIIPELFSMSECHQAGLMNVSQNYLCAAKAISHTSKILHMRLASLFYNLRGDSRLFSKSEIYSRQEQRIEAIKKILKNMHYDRDTIQKVSILVRYYDLEILVDERYIKKCMNKLTPQRLKEVLELRKVRTQYWDTNNSQKIIEIDQMNKAIDRILSDGECYLIKNLAIKGEEILKLGIAPGKLVGDILNYLLNAVIDGRVSNSKAELRSLAQEYLRQLQVGGS